MFIDWTFSVTVPFQVPSITPLLFVRHPTINSSFWEVVAVNPELGSVLLPEAILFASLLPVDKSPVT